MEKDAAMGSRNVRCIVRENGLGREEPGAKRDSPSRTWCAHGWAPLWTIGGRTFAQRAWVDANTRIGQANRPRIASRMTWWSCDDGSRIRFCSGFALCARICRMRYVRKVARRSGTHMPHARRCGAEKPLIIPCSISLDRGMGMGRKKSTVYALIAVGRP
jgi:hypothetical protein